MADKDVYYLILMLILLFRKVNLDICDTDTLYPGVVGS